MSILTFLRRAPGIVYLTLALAAAILVALLIHRLANPRVIGRAVTPDGVELCLVQRSNWKDDPFFRTTFAFRKPGTNWQTFYYHHEDNYWGHARVTLDTNTRIARFYRGNDLAITFAWESETYTMHRRNRTNTVQGGQWQMPAGWRPETAR